MLTYVFRHPLIITLGFGLILLGLYLTWRKHHMLLTGHLASGEVVELIPHSGSKGGTTYSLRISYTKTDEANQEFVTSFSSSPPMHQLNEKIRVIYYDNGTSPDIMAFQDLYLFPWVLCCTGVFILLICLGLAWGPSLIDSIYLPYLTNSDPLKTLHLVKDE